MIAKRVQIFSHKTYKEQVIKAINRGPKVIRGITNRFHNEIHGNQSIEQAEIRSHVNI